MYDIIFLNNISFIFLYCTKPRLLKNPQIILWVRLSPFPRVESRFNTHNQNAFANAFQTPFSNCCVYHRSLRITITSIQCVPDKQTPETKGCCDRSPATPAWPGCMTRKVWPIDHYAFLFIYLFIYLFIQLYMYVQNVSTKVQYLVYNCYHKHSVMRVHESEKELITVQCIWLQSLKQITTLNFNTETNIQRCYSISLKLDSLQHLWTVNKST